MHPVSGTEASVLLRCLSCAQRGLNSVCEVSESCSVMSDSLQPHGLYVARQAPLSMGILQTRILEWAAMPSSRGFFEPRSPTLQVDSLSSESPGKPKNTGVGSLSLLQGIFLTQELNWGLLPCSWILYQLSHKGSPRILQWVAHPFSSGSS